MICKWSESAGGCVCSSARTTEVVTRSCNSYMSASRRADGAPDTSLSADNPSARGGRESNKMAGSNGVSSTRSGGSPGLDALESITSDPMPGPRPAPVAELPRARAEPRSPPPAPAPDPAPAPLPLPPPAPRLSGSSTGPRMAMSSMGMDSVRELRDPRDATRRRSPRSSRFRSSR